ncbi:MAG: hypothetical protein NT175_09595 [Bacteroidetes bacterium]|nr:hypothetical protein [Bacteroidota bacterium]
MRKLAAIMFTDIVGYSALMSKDESVALQILVKNRVLQKLALSRFNGEFIKEIGDGTLSIFQSSWDAVSCAIDIQNIVNRESFFQLRIGIHIGDIVISDNDVFGDGVNIASRIEAGGKAGGIYVSERVYEDIKNKHNIKVEFVGEKTLKNIDHPVKIYSIDTGAQELIKKPVTRPSEQAKPIKIEGEKKIRIPKVLLLLGIGVILLTTVGLLVFLLPKPKSKPIQQRIVVAIFENRTGDASLDDLGKMAADWITQGLSQSVDANVVPTTTVLQISASVSPPASGKQHNNYLSHLAEGAKADIMVSGSYYLQKETLQFQAEVKNVKDGSLIYSLPAVTGSLQKPMEIIEKLSSEIIGGLEYHFRSNVRFISKPPNKDVYSEYITGMGLYSQDIEGAIQHLIRAINMDSLFCPPQFELAYAYINLGEYTRADSILQIINRIRERLSPFESHYFDSQIAYLNGNWAECLRHLRLAENISPGDWEINYEIGFLAVNLNKPGITVETYAKLDISYSYQSTTDLGVWRIGVLTMALHLLGNYQQELVEARKGQQYYPDWLLLYADEVRALAAIGQVEEIKKVIDKCHTISSRSGNVGDVIIEAALELRAHGYAQAAHEYAGKAVEWYRNRTASVDVREYLAFGFYISENWEEAQTEYEQLAAEYPENIDYLGYLGALAARKGEREKAMNITEKLKRIDRPYLFGQHTCWRARIAAQLGELAQAMELLQESFAQGKAFDINIHRDIDFEPLQDYQPFRELLKPKE